jgi:hypothetical protein
MTGARRDPLGAFYFADPRAVAIPIEHLGPAGTSADFAALALASGRLAPERLALFDRAFAAYWTRGHALAARTRTWIAPRRRHVVVVDDALAVRPYVQLLNTSAWMVYGAYLDPSTSHLELLAYLLVLGDRMAVTGEVTTAAVQTALWWVERSDDECAAFEDAAARSTRPDADALRAVARALPWLRRLHHAELRPPRILGPYRAIPGTGLLVPPAIAHEPPALAARWHRAAARTLDAYRASHRATDARATAALVAWLAEAAPRVLVTAGEAIVWDPARPPEASALTASLAGAPGAAVRSIHADLRVVARVTAAFEAAVVDPAGLPATPPANTMQSGYTYLHRERCQIAYDLREPGLERLLGPDVPYARLMLAARTAHEWAHLADAAGWVRRVVSDAQWAADRTALGALLEQVVREAPAGVRAAGAADVDALAAGRPLGEALVRLFASRLPDYRANLLARRLLEPAERETYVRHNVRTLAHELPPEAVWRRLARYLYEYQYLRPALGMTAIADPVGFFASSTWFDRDFFATRILDAGRFSSLADAAGRLCDAYALDATKLRVA